MPPFDAPPSASSAPSLHPFVGSIAGGDGLVTLFKTSDQPTIVRSNPRRAFTAPCDGSGRLVKLGRSLQTSSERHEAFALANGYDAFFCTLTYKGGESYQPRHISNLLLEMRRFAERFWSITGLRSTWVVEMQKRGALHYHLSIWVPNHISEQDFPKLDSQLILVPNNQRGLEPQYTRPPANSMPSQVIYTSSVDVVTTIPPLWPYGMTHRMKVDRKTGGNIVGYMCKFASKLQGQSKAGHELPKGVRLHGAGGLTARDKDYVRLAVAPGWLRSVIHVDETDRKLGVYDHSIRRATVENTRNDGTFKTVSGYKIHRIGPVFDAWVRDKAQKRADYIRARNRHGNLKRKRKLQGLPPPPPFPPFQYPPPPGEFFIPTPWRVLDFLKRSPTREVPALSVEWRGWTDEQMKGWPAYIRVAACAYDLFNRRPDGPISRGPDSGWAWDEETRWPSRLSLGGMTFHQAQALLSEMGLANGAELVDAIGSAPWRRPRMSETCSRLVFRIPAYDVATVNGGSAYIYDLAA